MFLKTISFGSLPISATWAVARKRRKSCAVAPRAVQQDHEKVLLVTNIKVDGEPIGAFGDGEFWFHIDSGYSPRPYKYTFLYALELPSTGGNTMFSNMYKAYEAVPPALKAKLKGKRALHIHEYNRAKQANHTGDISGIPHHYHPIFITHPDTGRKTLFVDRLMTTRIEGMSDEESDGDRSNNSTTSASGANSSSSMSGSSAIS